MYYLIKEKDIQTCSKNNIVSCWSEKYDCAYVEKCEKSEVIFSSYDTVEEV